MKINVHCNEETIHPGKINIGPEFRRYFFLFKRVIFRFHVHFQGWKMKECKVVSSVPRLASYYFSSTTTWHHRTVITTSSKVQQFIEELQYLLVAVSIFDLHSMKQKPGNPKQKIIFPTLLGGARSVSCLKKHIKINISSLHRSTKVLMR